MEGESTIADQIGASAEADSANPTGVVESPPQRESIMAMASSKALRPFVIISSSYLLFTITDGAIRMIVLLHAYNKNFSALEVAIMFTLYELAGVVTNLVSTATYSWSFYIQFSIRKRLTLTHQPTSFLHRRIL